MERRLRGRGTDSSEAISRRLDTAKVELAAVHLFDYAIVNDELEAAIAALLDVVDAERSGDEEVRRRHGRAGVLARLGPELPIPGMARTHR